MGLRRFVLVLAAVAGCGQPKVASVPSPAASSVTPPPAPTPATGPAKTPETKDDYVAVFGAYAPGPDDGKVAAAATALLAKAGEAPFHGDEALGRALVEGLTRVKFASSSSGEVGLLFGELLCALAPKGAAPGLVAIVNRPNPGTDTIEAKELTAQQVIAAEALGFVGDASVVPAMVDRMFVLAATLAARKDPTTGDDLVLPSRLTTAVSQLLGGALAQLGAPAIAPLLPYAKADVGHPGVKAVAKLFSGYVSADGTPAPDAYADLATSVLANVGLPQVAAEVSTTLKDKVTKSVVRRRLLGLLVALPPTPAVLDAIREGYAAVDPPQKVLVAASAARTMSPTMTGWLLGVAGAKGVSADLADAALGSAAWLAGKGELAAVTKAYGKGLARKDPSSKVLVASTTPCDPKAPKQKASCQASPQGDGHVLWNDVTPTFGEVHAQLAEVLACDKDPKCYLAELKKSAAAYDKQGFTSVTLEATLAGIRAQKAFWMLAAYGTEDDMVALVELFPSFHGPALRAFGQMTLTHCLASGSKVAAAIESLVRRLRVESPELARREKSQLAPIAHMLRVRAQNP